MRSIEPGISKLFCVIAQTIGIPGSLAFGERLGMTVGVAE
jgi:hypothetical protein